MPPKPRNPARVNVRTTVDREIHDRLKAAAARAGLPFMEWLELQLSELAKRKTPFWDILEGEGEGRRRGRRE